MKYTNTGAEFSVCGKYRYVLWRRWDEDAGASLHVIGLNPSTADAKKDDPTIRRCVGFAKREGLGGLVMLNLFAWRSTDPDALRSVADPVGPLNDQYWLDWVEHGPVVFAWSGHRMVHSRQSQALAMFPNGLCFGKTKDGHPRHPLYLPSNTPLVKFSNGVCP